MPLQVAEESADFGEYHTAAPVESKSCARADVKTRVGRRQRNVAGVACMGRGRIEASEGATSPAP